MGFFSLGTWFPRPFASSDCREHKRTKPLQLLPQLIVLKEDEHPHHVKHHLIEPRLCLVHPHPLQQVTVRERHPTPIQHLAVVVCEHVTEARHSLELWFNQWFRFRTCNGDMFLRVWRFFKNWRNIQCYSYYMSKSKVSLDLVSLQTIPRIQMYTLFHQSSLCTPSP